MIDTDSQRGLARHADMDHSRHPGRRRDLCGCGLQSAGAPAQSRARRLERDRRAIEAAHRSRAQSGRDRESLCGARAQRARGGDGACARRASRRAMSAARRRRSEALQGSLGKLLAVAEAYPELKANKNFLALQQQLADIEDQLQMARRYYNGTVRNLNIASSRFPTTCWPACSASARSRSSSSTTAPRRRRPASRFRRPNRERDDHEQLAQARWRSLLLLRWQRRAAARWRRAHPALRQRCHGRAQRRSRGHRDDPRPGRAATQIRHGILRDFPTTYTRPDGSRVVVGFAVQSVTRDGADEHWATEPMANGVRVRIGSADTQLSTGAARVRHPLSHHAADRLFRGLRRALLERHRHRLDASRSIVAEARITLPDARAVHADRVLHRRRRARSGTGRRDRRPSSPATSCSARPGRCRRGNGLTVAAAWQKGVVAPPTRASRPAGGCRTICRRRSRGLGLAGIVWAYLRFRVAAVRPRSADAAPSFRCSGRPTACRRRPCATSSTWGSTTAALPPRSSISASTAISGSTGDRQRDRASRTSTAASRSGRPEQRGGQQAVRREHVDRAHPGQLQAARRAPRPRLSVSLTAGL